MWTYNCARVYSGRYGNSGTNEDWRQVECSYKVLEGKVNKNRLEQDTVRGYDGEGFSKTYRLQSFLLSPLTQTAVVSIINSRGVRLIRLTKSQQGKRNTMFKMRL